MDGTAEGRHIFPTLSAQEFFEEIWQKLNLPEPVRPSVELTDYSALAAAAEQRPAAYRFTFRHGKVDVIPERPEPENQEFAVDTYNELVRKATELLHRLRGSNSASRTCRSAQGLLDALGTSFEALRPGVLLSRVRSVEADRMAFDSEEARAELFADALATLDDTLQSARDLMALFPMIRVVEAERLALDLDRQPIDLPIIEQQTENISAAAEQSDAATAAAVTALRQNDSAIQDASDPLLRMSLFGDQLLVVRNFGWAVASRVGAELAELGGNTWQAVKAEVPIGVGLAVRAAPLMTLATLLAGPAGLLAAAVPAFKPLASRLQSLRADPRSC